MFFSTMLMWFDVTLIVRWLSLTAAVIFMTFASDSLGDIMLSYSICRSICGEHRGAVLEIILR